MINPSSSDTVHRFEAGINPAALCSSFAVNKEYSQILRLSMDDAPKNGISAIILRIQEVLGVDSDIAICNKLGKSKGWVSNWRKSGQVPASAITLVALTSGCSTDWIQTGQDQKKSPYPEGGTEAKLIDKVAEALPVYNGSELSDEEIHFLRLYRELTQEQRNSLVLIASGFALNTRKRGGSP